MERNEMQESLDAKLEIVDKADLEQKIQGVDGEKGTFRFYDTEQNGEICTQSINREGIFRETHATFYGRDGKVQTIGTARYSVEMDEAKIYPEHFQALNGQTETALIAEIGEQAKAQGVNKISVWVKDSEVDPQRWARRGFQPTERAPGAAGAFWQKQLLS
jgi:hypothetical protein